MLNVIPPQNLKNMTYKSLLLLVASSVSANAAESMRDTLLLSEFTVTALSKSDIELLPLNVTNVSANDIYDATESSLLPILADATTGIFVSERGFAGYGISTSAAGTLNIRGIGQGNKVLFLIDGQPQWNGIYGHSSPDTYSAIGVKSVDIIKGPASLIYGSNAMGGAINIHTNKLSKDSTYAAARVTFGSYSTQKFDFSTGIRRGKWQANGASQFVRSNGNRAGSEFWVANEFAQLQYSANTHINIGTSFNATQSVSNFPGTTQSPLEDMSTDIFRYTAAIYADNNYNSCNGAIRAYINYGRHKINDGHAPGAAPAADIFHSTDYNWGISLNENIDTWRGNTISAGASMQYWGGHIKNGIKKKDRELGIFALMQQSFGKIISLNAGLRLQHGNFGNILIPQAGFLIYPFNNFHLRGAYSKGFRSPNIRELYIGEAANSELRAERMNNFEISIGKSFWRDRLKFDVSMFFIQAENIIQTEIVDARPKNMNAGAFRNKGIEVSSSAIISKAFIFTANYSYLYTTSENLLYAPKNMLSAQLTADVANFTVSIQSQSVWRLNNGGQHSTNYSLLNTRIAYKYKISPFVKLDNLTNKHYEIMYCCPMPGTTILCGLQTNF